MTTLKISKLPFFIHYIIFLTFLFYVFFISPTFSFNDSDELLGKSSNTKALVLWTSVKTIQQTVHDRELQRAWEIIKASTRFQRFGRGEIILLYGTSSAGKTSICNHLRRDYPTWSFESLDKSIDMHLVMLLQRLFPKEFRRIARTFANDDIISVIFEGKGHFRKSATSTMQKKASDACLYIKDQGELIDGSFCLQKVKDEMYEKAFLRSQLGQPVVIDTTGFQEFITYKEQCLFNCPIRYVLVHCPFSKISERTAKRNTEAELRGDTSNARYGTHPFFQFAKLFKVSTKGTEVVIESVHREIVLKSFNFNFDEDARKFPPVSAFENEVKRALDRKNLLERLGFLDDRVSLVHLTSRFPYNLILNTHVNSSDACARMIGNPHVF